ncbi:MAG TPA: hypothetical protein VJ623_03655 [Holophagaceae bacterium]|nr:hypothetical protein [Holophagaceae bacterium]
MSGPAPLQPTGPLFLEALRLVEGVSSLEASLAASPGAELKAVLADINAQGLLLQLADGRSLKAAGDLPYPPGTELTFRIQPQADGTTQLQPLRAEPPPAPALLAPLVRGEATALLQRLTAPDLPAALAPLKDLLERLPAPSPTVASAPPAPSLPPPLAPLAEALGLPSTPPAATELNASPTPPRTPDQPLVEPPPAPPAAPMRPSAEPAGTLPAPPAAELATALVARGLPPEPAQALARLLTGEAPAEIEAQATRPQPEAEPSPETAPSAPPLPRAETPPDPGFPRVATPAAPSLDRALLRAFGLPESLIQALLPEAAEIPTPARPPSAVSAPDSGPDADARLKQVLDRLPPPLAQRVLALLTLLPPPGQGQALPRQDPLAQLLRSLLPQLQAAAPESGPARAQQALRAGTPAELQPSEPSTWGRWLKEVTSALSRPEASPAEAPFHRLQAREGTALFEVPLPWAPEPSTLELWAERETQGPDRPESHRVLLALTMGRTGELRVALQSGPAGVQAQVVAAPEVAARLERLLREELGEPAPFQLQVRAASELPPRPRVLAGRGLQALG